LHQGGWFQSFLVQFPSLCLWKLCLSLRVILLSIPKAIKFLIVSHVSIEIDIYWRAELQKAYCPFRLNLSSFLPSSPIYLKFGQVA
jgi:hypothetical protein